MKERDKTMTSRAETNTDPRLHALLVGESNELEKLRRELEQHTAVESATVGQHTHHAWSSVLSGTVNTVIVDLEETPYDDIDSVASMIFRMRDEFPEIVFALLGDEKELAVRTVEAPQAAKTRLGHYYRLSRSFDSTELEKLVERCLQWHRTLINDRPGTACYKYDVALSFAGEQRSYADELAKILRAQGVRVFYDTFEQAELWGKNLGDHLADVYSRESRYCIMFVSAEYASRMWTEHERRSIQERVLREKEVEYLLPIKVDDTRLQGLPSTIAYLDIGEGIKRIAQLFVRKLGVTIGDLQ